METAQDRFKSVVEKTGLVEVIQAASVEREESDPPHAQQKVALQVRVKYDEMARWLPFVDFLLQEEEEQESDDSRSLWSLHICKTFMRIEGKLGYVWTLVVSTKGDLKRCISDISRAVRIYNSNFSEGNLPRYPAQAQPAVQKAAQVVANHVNGLQPVMHRVGDRIEVDVMPLVGVTEDRNKPISPTSKGARLIQGG